MKAGGEADDREQDGWLGSLTLDMSLIKLQETLKNREAGVLHAVQGSQRAGHDWVTEQQHRLFMGHTGHPPAKTTG